MKLKKITITILMLSITLLAKTNIIVTVAPQKIFVEKIGGEFVNVNVMVPIGADPHSYEPTPLQMVAISKANIYMKIELEEFEKPWLSKLSAQNRDMKIENIAKNANHINFENEHHNEHEDEHHHGSEDPHIWTSPKEVKNIAKNILNILINYDKKNENIYKLNYEKFLNEIEYTDKKIREILKDIPKNSKIMVFHPAFGYFARDYNLIQFAIEFEGKKPKPKMLAYMIREAKEDGIKTIITEPEFSDKSAKVIANEVGAKVKAISPLSPNWSENLIELAKTIKSSYN